MIVWLEGRDGEKAGGETECTGEKVTAEQAVEGALSSTFFFFFLLTSVSILFPYKTKINYF